MAIYHRVLTKGRYLFKCFNSLWAHTYTSLTLMLLYLYLLLWKKLSQVSVNATLFSKRGLRVEIPVKTRMLLNRRMVIVQENFTVFNLYYCNGDKIFHLCFLWEWIYLPLFLVKEKFLSSYKRISLFLKELKNWSVYYLTELDGVSFKTTSTTPSTLWATQITSTTPTGEGEPDPLDKPEKANCSGGHSTCCITLLSDFSN